MKATNPLAEKQQKALALSAILAAAEAAEAGGAEPEAVFDTILIVAMHMVTVAEGGLAGLARWHRAEAEGLEARIANIN